MYTSDWILFFSKQLSCEVLYHSNNAGTMYNTFETLP